MGGKSNGNGCTCCSEIDARSVTTFGCQEIQPIYRRFSFARRWRRSRRRRREVARGRDILACYGSELVAEFGSRLWNSRKEEEKASCCLIRKPSLEFMRPPSPYNSVHRLEIRWLENVPRMVMRLGNLSDRICPNSFRVALGVKGFVPPFFLCNYFSFS